MTDLYEQAVSGAPTRLAELTVQYPDFAVWQRQQVQGQRLQALRSYWDEVLRGAAVLDLPTDFPRLPRQRFEGAGVARTLSAELTAGLRGLVRELQVTPFMLVLGGFAAVLGRYCGQDDVIVGSPVANRPRRELEQLIGYFVNMVPAAGRPVR